MLNTFGRRAVDRRVLLPLCLVLAVTAILATTSRARAEEGDPAQALANDAETARAAGLFERCIDKDRAAIELDPSDATRVHLAGCADRAGKVLLALEQLRAVLEHAIAARDAELSELTRKRVEQLLKRLGSLTIDPPPGATDLRVTVDSLVVAQERYGKSLAVDPGVHRIQAEGMLDGSPAVFDEVRTVGEGERANVPVTLIPRGPQHLTPGQLACLQSAKNDAEAFRCLPGKSKPLVVRAALEMSVYADSLSVLVLAPLVRAHVSSPTKGWSVGASYLVDVVSAASPDFVSTASPRGRDTRHAVAASGGYKPGTLGVDASAGISTESDYVSRSGGLAVLADLFDKRVTPRLGWNIAYDTIGRGGTPYDFFHNTLVTNEGAFSTSFVLSPRVVLVTGASLGIERGDPSKPYRLIPMFANGVSVPAGASADLVNANRLPVRPYEQLPRERDRLAFGARLAWRLGSSTLRVEERLYGDTWNNRASTTDVRWLVDTSSRFTFGPHIRFHVQTGAGFFRRVYNADVASVVSVPSFRTTDRELGPFHAYTLGASAWWKLSAHGSGDDSGSLSWMIYASADALYSRYSDSLYIQSRVAGYGTMGIEAVFE